MATMDYETENNGRYDGERYNSRDSYRPSHRLMTSIPQPTLSGRTFPYRLTDLPYFPDEQRYDRDRERSASPRGMKRDDNYRGGRQRSASPAGRMDSRYKIIKPFALDSSSTIIVVLQ